MGTRAVRSVKWPLLVTAVLTRSPALAGVRRHSLPGVDRDRTQTVRAAQGEVGLPGPVDEGGRGGYLVELYCHIGIGGRGEGEFVYDLALLSVDLSVEVVVGTIILLELVLVRYRDLAVVFRYDRGRLRGRPAWCRSSRTHCLSRHQAAVWLSIRRGSSCRA